MVMEQSVEKLFNTLGKNLAMKYYGLDVHFTVLGVEEIDDKFYEIKIKTDKPLPVIFDVKTEPEFKYGKYAQIQDLLYNLEYLTRYLGMNGADVHLQQEEWPKTWETQIDKNYYIEHPQEFIELESVGSVVEVETGYVYPLFENDTLDVDSLISLARIEDDEWWDHLSEEDKNKLNRIYAN